jgi:hypothetical protein
MNGHAKILVVAAAAREFAESGDWLTLECGVGPSRQRRQRLPPLPPTIP